LGKINQKHAIMGHFWFKVYITQIGGSRTVSLVTGVNKQPLNFLMMVAMCSSVTAKWSYGRLKRAKE